MNDLKKNIVLAILLGIIFILHQIPEGSAKEMYQLNINETGTSFNEVIEIDDKRKTVVYKVPSHNEIKKTDVLVDYKNGYIATKIPEREACYIKQFPTADEQSLRETRQNLKLLRVMKSQTQQPIPIRVINRIMKRIRQIPRNELSLKILEFCGNNTAYEVKEVNMERKRGLSIAKRTGVQVTTSYAFSSRVHGNAQSVQQSLPNGYLTCKNVKEHTKAILACFSKGIKKPKVGCGLFPVTCRYQATCNLLPKTAKKINSNSLRDDGAATAYINVEMTCVEQHMFTAEWCCDVLPC